MDYGQALIRITYILQLSKILNVVDGLQVKYN